MKTLPSLYLGTLLDLGSLRIATGMCKSCNFICGHPVEKFGIQDSSCLKNRVILCRYASLNVLIKRALSTAGFPSVLEPSGLICSNCKGPDGMSSIPFSNGKCLI